MNHLLLAQGPPELAGGRYAAPAWVILTLGFAVAAGAFVYVALRLRRLRAGRDKR